MVGKGTQGTLWAAVTEWLAQMLAVWKALGSIPNVQATV